MNAEEQAELLIRVDERVGTLVTQMDKVSKRPCIVHTEKIKTLERITWTAMVVALGASIKSFFIT